MTEKEVAELAKKNGFHLWKHSTNKNTYGLTYINKNVGSIDDRTIIYANTLVKTSEYLKTYETL